MCVCVRARAHVCRGGTSCFDDIIIMDSPCKASSPVQILELKNFFWRAALAIIYDYG